MSDEYGQIRPEREDYLDDLAEIRERLERGEVVYVEHAENMTSHKLLLVPGGAVHLFTEPCGTNVHRTGKILIFYEGHGGPLVLDTEPHADWVHQTYAGEKLACGQWPGDAISLANFANRLLGWGEDKMQGRS